MKTNELRILHEKSRNGMSAYNNGRMTGTKFTLLVKQSESQVKYKKQEFSDFGQQAPQEENSERSGENEVSSTSATASFQIVAQGENSGC